MGTKIVVKQTSHPHAETFVLPSGLFSKPGRSFYSPEEASEDTTAAALFAVSGTLTVFYVGDRVTVRRHPKVDVAIWRQGVVGVLEDLSQHLAKGGC